jgi:MarR family protein
MNSARAGLTDSRNTPRFRRFDAAATASGESPVGGDGNVPLSTGDAFTPRELAAWQGLLEVHAHVLRQLDLQMQAAHGLTLSQSEVLIFLDDAPYQRVRMAELAKGVLLSSGGTRLVERLETLGYVTRGQPPTIDAGCSLSSRTPAGMWSWRHERPIERVSAQPFLTDSGQPTKWLFPSFRHGSADGMFELPPNFDQPHFTKGRSR